MEKEQITTSIQTHILIKMVEHKYWKHKHTNINNLPKGMPSFLRSSGHVKTAIKELIKSQFHQVWALLLLLLYD